MAALDEPRRSVGVQVGTEGHDQHVAIKGTGVGLHPLGHRVDGLDRGLQEPHARLHDVGVAVVHVVGGRLAEHDVELREAEDEAVGSVDEHDIGVVTQRLRQPRRQLQPPEPRSQDEYAHGRGR